MKIFLTGATGGIGKHLVPALLKAGHFCTLLSIAPEPAYRNDSNARVILGDLTDSASYEDALQGIDCIVHMAAVTHTNDTKLYYRINTTGTKILLDAAKTMHVPRFIFMSTRAVGKVGGAYSDSKEQAEKLVENSGLAWTIVRPAEVYGVSGDEAITKLIRSIEKLPFVLIIGDGCYTLAPVHVDDVIMALVNIIDRKDITAKKTYTLSGPEEMSYQKLVERILIKKSLRRIKVHVPIAVFRLAVWFFSLLPLKTPPVVKDQVPRLLLPKAADNTASKKDLGFDPRHLIASGEPISRGCRTV